MNAGTDRHDLAAEYVLGTLDAVERAEADALIATDTAFAALVGDWEHRLGELSAMVTPVNPPAELWAAIQQRLAQDATAAAAAVPPPEPEAPVGTAAADAAAETAQFATAHETMPTEAAAAEPVSGEPVPSEPVPSEPVPSEPVPSEPVPSEPVPGEATPGEPPPPESPSTEGAEIEAADFGGTRAEAVGAEAASATEMPPPAGAEAAAAAADAPSKTESDVVGAEHAETDAASPGPTDSTAALLENAERPVAEPVMPEAENAEVKTDTPELLELNAALRETVERIAAESEAGGTASVEEKTATEAAVAMAEAARIDAAPVEMTGTPDAAETTASARVASAAAGPDQSEGERGESATVIDLTRRARRWRGVATVFGMLAAGLAAVIVTAAHAPDYLPEALRPRPEVRTVEVPREVVRTVKVPAPTAGRFVAVMQNSATAPAFIVTVDVAQRNLTVRRVAAETQAGHSYELWLVSNRFQEPRSLGVIGASEFTHPATLSAYDPETISDATFAVSLEPEGGSPTGQPTGPVLFSGKLVEAVPPAPATTTP